ncbi:SGNH/GDSL hydrolase family protein [Candidatus Galacturonibacter soehngenii]|uniref:SGNH/GDSL hydrolase family protein n=1 Tax=Candidatus Galacturonatibacter soehngenii TaxID=2307010 RepID=A0A7V7QM02_9FIRM|nr:SGNH/GDSL hydrolase family protein [Candidatus Galacturonibacter soehngenii]KAB1439609.1 SGNH/GDSL hydrolase family protein [Candidatus Galacturonibacter soehngenii]
MEGPKAPMDPQKRRPFFYIMREKEVFGAKQIDGKGVSFIYQNDGRLMNSALIVGNITDNKILNLLKTTEGFRKLVHSIGVSVESDCREDSIEFVFQMYGKKDVYGGGSLLKVKLKGDGAESRINLSDIERTEDEFEPGQIRFVFEVPEKIARASVRFYLNDGYRAPEVAEEAEIDFTSKDYQAMIERSLIQTGNAVRTMKAIKKARAGEEVTLAYIGGSITQGAGAVPINKECYAFKSYQAFASKYGTGDNVHYVKAGVGGTPSELGMLRFERDILRDGIQPDIVIVEFAVNDEGDETKGKCYESLVKKILLLPNNPAVILLFAVFASDWNLQERLFPVGRHYDLPMVSVLNAVTPQFQMKHGEGRVLSKNQFFYDVFHPSNVGHTIMADCLTNLFCVVEKMFYDNKDELAVDPTFSLLLQKAVIGDEFTKVKLIDKRINYDICKITSGDFTETDRELQCVEMDENLEGTPQFPYNWMYDGTKGGKQRPYLEVEIKAKAFFLIFKDSGALDVGKVDIYVDGRVIRTADPHQNGWIHCNAILVFNEAESKEHIIRVQMSEGDEEKKFTILGFGYVE